MFDFTGKRVLVTGSSRGIGRAAAQAFLRLGARVAVNGRDAASTSAGVAVLGPRERIVATPGDVRTTQGCEAIVRAAVEGLGGLDVLVNSAGVAERRPLKDVDEAMWD